MVYHHGTTKTIDESALEDHFGHQHTAEPGTD